MKTIEQLKRDFPELVFESFRYCLGRKTYAVSSCVDRIIRYWDELPGNYRSSIKSEIELAVKSGNAGHPTIDVPQWERILKL